jgi:preprotein translocase subunit SecF
MVSVGGRMTYTQMASLSLNQVLVRSINTSLTAMLPVLSILVVGSLIFGATTLEEFGLALLVGLTIGVYSSIFVATPIVAYLNERTATYRAVRQRLTSRPATVPAAESAGTRTEADAVAPAGRSAPAGRTPPAARRLPAGYSASHPPRPRKKRR